MKRLSEEEVEQLNLLKEMYRDGWFPNHLVDRVKGVLIEICRKIESGNPKNEEELYVITHRATEKINDLQSDFEEEGSEIETVARDSIAVSFGKVAEAYGFEVDLEELIAPRDW
ncbi:DUF5713 family protein [Microbulbifer sp. SSSA002]|uniref:DUF5713 family protein n=1 Tax=unclassified Microbulbifer TaxID=2619833 RepID=UPI00403A377A